MDLGLDGILKTTFQKHLMLSHHPKTIPFKNTEPACKIQPSSKKILLWVGSSMVPRRFHPLALILPLDRRVKTFSPTSGIFNHLHLHPTPNPPPPPRVDSPASFMCPSHGSITPPPILAARLWPLALCSTPDKGQCPGGQRGTGAVRHVQRPAKLPATPFHPLPKLCRPKPRLGDPQFTGTGDQRNSPTQMFNDLTHHPQNQPPSP